MVNEFLINLELILDEFMWGCLNLLIILLGIESRGKTQKGLFLFTLG